MQISRTRIKYLETMFFLEKLQRAESVKNAFATKRGNANPFMYYLDAFLSSFRSITYVMQKEFNRKEGFKEWYEKQRIYLKNDENFKILDIARDISIHENTYEPKFLDLGKSHGMEPNQLIMLLFSNQSDNENILLSKSELNSISSICVKCLKKMESIVNECDSLFLN